MDDEWFLGCMEYGPVAHSAVCDPSTGVEPGQTFARTPPSGSGSSASDAESGVVGVNPPVAVTDARPVHGARAGAGAGAGASVSASASVGFGAGTYDAELDVRTPTPGESVKFPRVCSIGSLEGLVDGGDDSGACSDSCHSAGSVNNATPPAVPSRRRRKGRRRSRSSSLDSECSTQVGARVCSRVWTSVLLTAVDCHQPAKLACHVAVPDFSTDVPAEHNRVKQLWLQTASTRRAL